MEFREDHDAKNASSYSNRLFAHIEHAVYIVLGGILSVAAIFTLCGAAMVLWQGLDDWRGTHTIFETIDRLLFVLMLAEIPHTVRVSIRSGELNAEPFLIVGLIATIRRVLVITLESSQAAQGRSRGPEANASFQASMIELSILGGLILVMVASIWLLRRARGTEA